MADRIVLSKWLTWTLVVWDGHGVPEQIQLEGKHGVHHLHNDPEGWRKVEDEWMAEAQTQKGHVKKRLGVFLLLPS